MKRLPIRAAAALLAAALFLCIPAEAVSARRAIVIDAATGRTLYEKNADEESLIASTTKIMTALVICQQCNVLDRVRIPPEAVGVEGSSMYLKEGEILTVQELLYGLMLQSGNDAAVALAIYCGGTVEGFAEMMNDKARSLGLKQTHFVNPNGLDAPEHYSTARDLARLAAYAMEDPIFRQTVSTKQIRLGQRCMTNHNKLLWQVEGAEGVKTGYTKAAGRILVSSVQRQGRRLVCVTMDDPDDWRDHAQLYEMGFEEYSIRPVVEKGMVLGYAQVLEGQEEWVPLISLEELSCALTQQEQPQVVLPRPGFVYAPVVEGAEAGFAYVMLGETVLGRVALAYGETVECKPPERRSFWSRIFGG